MAIQFSDFELMGNEPQGAQTSIFVVPLGLEGLDQKLDKVSEGVESINESVDVIQQQLVAQNEKISSVVSVLEPLADMMRHLNVGHQIKARVL